VFRVMKSDKKGHKFDQFSAKKQRKKRRRDVSFAKLSVPSC
jgi:hypothetical protein